VLEAVITESTYNSEKCFIVVWLAGDQITLTLI